MASAAAVVAAIVVWAHTHAAPTPDLRRPFQALGKTSGDCMSLGDGAEVPVAGAPCVRCVCRRGALVCRLQVCPELPEPPPPSCTRVHRKGRCCASLQCGSDLERNEARRETEIEVNLMNNRQACLINGTSYAEGAALANSNPCEPCYCIGGQQRCLQPLCSLSVPGCRPQLRPQSCCPTSYDCQDMAPEKPTSTPTSSSSAANSKYEILGSTSKNELQLETSDVGRSHSPVTTAAPTTDDLQVAASNTTSELALPDDTTIASTIEWTTTSEPAETTITSVVTTTNTDETVTESTQPRTEPVTPEIITDDIITIAQTEPDVITSSDVDISVEQKEGDEGSMTTTVIVPGEMLAVNVTLHSDLNISLPRINSSSLSINKNISNASRLKLAQLEPILLLTEKKDMEDVENSEEIDEDFGVSLPPSLPNVRIIPFLVEDAVLEGKERIEDILPDNNRPENLDYYKGTNLFSPPAETEGGFVPKEGLLDGTYYDTRFDIVLYETTETESPTVVLDRGEIPSSGVVVPPVTVAEGVVTPDPTFRDVIRTEPAPDLPSLIADLQLIEKPNSNTTTPMLIIETTTTIKPSIPPNETISTKIPQVNTTINPISTTTPKIILHSDKKKEEEEEEEFSFKNVLQLLFSDSNSEVTEKASQNISSNNINNEQSADRRNDENIEEEIPKISVNDTKSSTPATSSHSNHLLKVAGCNIYGRMYAVGKIITELSNPCLQCICSELGVQCRGSGC